MVIDGAGGRATAVPVDIADEAAVQTMVDETTKSFGDGGFVLRP